MCVCAERESGVRGGGKSRKRKRRKGKGDKAYVVKCLNLGNLREGYKGNLLIFL